MSEVLDFGGAYAEALSVLTELGSLMQTNKGSVDEQVAALEQGHSTLEQAQATAEQLLESLGQGLDGGSSATQAAGGEVTNAVTSLLAAGEQGKATLADLKQATTDAYDEVSDEVGGTVEEANTLHGEVTGAIDEAVAATQETMSQMDNAADLTRQTLGDLESSVTELTDRVSSLGEETLGKAGDLASKITDDVTSRAEGLFGDVTQALGSDFFDQAVAGFEGLTSNVDNLYENFDSFVNGLGENLMNRLEEVFMNTINHAQDEAAGKIEAEIQELVDDAIAYVAEEITSNMTMATAGSSTTAALGPALPVIVALKGLVSAIKHALAILRMGF